MTDNNTIITNTKGTKKTYHYEVINIFKRFVLRQKASGTHCLPDQ